MTSNSPEQQIETEGPVTSVQGESISTADLPVTGAPVAALEVQGPEPTVLAESAAANTRRLQFWVFAFVALIWVIRLPFVTIVTMLNPDEWNVWTAAHPLVAYDFIHTANWGERYNLLERISSGGRLLWIFGHLIAAYLVYAPFNMAFAVSQVWGLIAMASVAGAARRLYGTRAFLLCLVMTAASPYLLNYSLRIVGTMQSVGWLCVALFFFSSRAWGAFPWIAGGLCMGMAFGAHYGAGPAIVAIAIGLGLSAAMELFRRGLDWRSRIWRAVVCPVLGGAAAALPLFTLEVWARSSGGVYFDRLLHHENVTTGLGVNQTFGNWFEVMGPIGMWIRFLFEFDPLLQVCFFLAFAYVIRPRWRSNWVRIPLMVLMLSILALLISGMGEAIPRGWVSILACSGLGLLSGWRRWPERRGEAESPDAETKANPEGRPIWGTPSLIASLVFLIVINSAWRNVSLMPRHIFGGWPIFVLGSCGLMHLVFRKHMDRVIRGAMIVGFVAFMMGISGSAVSKSVLQRLSLYKVFHPDLTDVYFFSFFLNSSGVTELWERASDNVVTVGPSVNLFPSMVYDEEIFKVIDTGTRIRVNGLTHLLNEYSYFGGYYAYEKIDRTGTIFPPPGTPLVPQSCMATDGAGKALKVGVHSYRGMELKFLPSDKGGERSAKLKFDVPASSDLETARCGFEWTAVGPNLPPGSRLALSIEHRGASLGQIDGAQVQPRGTNFVKFLSEIKPMEPTEAFTVTARLTTPDNLYCPPMTLYVRRPFVQIPPQTKPLPYVSGFDHIIEADKKLPDMTIHDGSKSDFYLTDATFDEKGKGVRWVTPPWSGKGEDVLTVLTAVAFTPICRLSINGEWAIDFRQRGPLLVWENENASVQFWSVGTGSSYMIGLLSIRLPEGSQPKNKPVEIEIRVVNEDVTGRLKSDPKGPPGVFGIIPNTKAQELFKP